MKVKEFLENKTIMFYGDSITHNWLVYTHDMEKISDTDKFSGYVGYIDEKIKNKKIINKAVSGGCYTSITYLNPVRQEYRHFNYQIEHSIDDLKESDAVFVFFGTNDYSEQGPFGRNDDKSKDNRTLYAAMNNGFDKIKKCNPNAKIFIITPLKRLCPVETTRAYNYSLDEYVLAIRQFAGEHNIEIIDANNLFTYEDAKINLQDGLHPNELGHELLANFILEHEIIK